MRPGDVVLDVGANMGYYSVKLAARVGEAGHVYSFEPNTRLQGFIRDSLNVNGFWTRYTIVPAAAGSRAGRSTLTFDPAMPGGGTVGLPETAVTAGQSRIQIPVVRIDDIVPEDKPVDLIKIDVEGFEPHVIGGMTAVMARSPDAAVVIEVAYQAWASVGDPGEILTKLAGDRRIFRIDHDGAIEELNRDDLSASLNQIVVSYVLLLPPTEARWRQVRRFVRSEREALSEAASTGPPVDRSAPAAQPVRNSLLGRLRRRLAAMIAP